MNLFKNGNPIKSFTQSSDSRKLTIYEHIKRLYRINFKSFSNCEISSDKWNSQYKSGYWNYLSDIKELGHYSVIAGYSNFFSPNANILDIGCGNGVMQQILNKSEYVFYTGIDISSEAIALAEKYADLNTHFICSSVDSYQPDRLYDIIIINECLYYLRDPITTINTLRKCLRTNGKIIISMHGDDEPIVNCWNMIDKLQLEEDSTMVTHKSGMYWIIKVIRKE